LPERTVVWDLGALLGVISGQIYLHLARFHPKVNLIALVNVLSDSLLPCLITLSRVLSPGTVIPSMQRRKQLYR
jgi:hypothetical protein